MAIHLYSRCPQDDIAGLLWLSTAIFIMGRWIFEQHRTHTTESSSYGTTVAQIHGIDIPRCNRTTWSGSISMMELIIIGIGVP